MKNRKYVLLSLIVFIAIKTFGNEFTFEELEILKNRNLITAEEYKILKSELDGTLGLNGEVMYSVTINNRIRSNFFKLLKKDGKTYFPLFDFLQLIEFKNYDYEKDFISLSLGKDLYKVKVDFTTFTASVQRLNQNLKFNESDIFRENSQVYIEKELFEKMFLNKLEVDEKKHDMRMNLYFQTPAEINMSLDNAFDRRDFGNRQGELLFTNNNKLFDLGYLLLDFNGELTKENRGNKKFESDWRGDLEYQGNLLYGQFNTSYDVKNGELEDAYFYYPELYKQHSLEVGSYKNTEREYGLSFRKEKGYFYEGKEIVIRENVPLGSRVELLYLGFPIDVGDSEDGVIEFRNREIKSDRSYSLRVYTPEGKIYDIGIDTAVDFRQQNIGEFEYDFSAREDYLSKKTKTDANIYYGLTDNLTLGAGFGREIENLNNTSKYIDQYDGELIYSNSIFRNPYTLVLGHQYDDKDKSSNYVEGQIDIKDFKFYHQNRRWKREYQEQYGLEYNPGSFYSLDYNYYRTKDFNGLRENDYNIGVSVYKNIFRDTLITAEATKYRKEGDEYSLNLYYTGFHYFNTRWSHSFLNDGKDYETTLTLTNKNLWDMVDFSLEMGYSSTQESRVTLKFDILYDRWFRGGGRILKNGDQRYNAGIYKVVDLKDVTKRVDYLDSSRVKVLTFIDTNGNNKYDPSEKLVDNVEVTIGSQKIVTDEKGVAYFYGVPNGILYNLNPKIRKPSYSMGDNKVAVRGTNTGTIDVFIPLKPMITLSGLVVFDDSLKLDEKQKKEIYENTLVKIKNEEGKVLENTIPDEEGIFYVSGLLPETYTLDIIYFGNDLNISSLTEKINLVYNEETENKMVLQFKKNELALILEKQNKLEDLR